MSGTCAYPYCEGEVRAHLDFTVQQFDGTRKRYRVALCIRHWRRIVDTDALGDCVATEVEVTDEAERDR